MSRIYSLSIAPVLCLALVLFVGTPAPSAQAQVAVSAAAPTTASLQKDFKVLFDAAGKGFKKKRGSLKKSDGFSSAQSGLHIGRSGMALVFINTTGTITYRTTLEKRSGLLVTAQVNAMVGALRAFPKRLGYKVITLKKTPGAAIFAFEKRGKIKGFVEIQNTSKHQRVSIFTAINQKRLTRALTTALKGKDAAIRSYAVTRLKGTTGSVDANTVLPYADSGRVNHGPGQVSWISIYTTYPPEALMHQIAAMDLKVGGATKTLTDEDGADLITFMFPVNEKGLIVGLSLMVQSRGSRRGSLVILSHTVIDLEAKRRRKAMSPHYRGIKKGHDKIAAAIKVASHTLKHPKGNKKSAMGAFSASLKKVHKQMDRTLTLISEAVGAAYKLSCPRLAADLQAISKGLERGSFVVLSASIDIQVASVSRGKAFSRKLDSAEKSYAEGTAAVHTFGLAMNALDKSCR